MPAIILPCDGADHDWDNEDESTYASEDEEWVDDASESGSDADDGSSTSSGESEHSIVTEDGVPKSFYRQQLIFHPRPHGYFTEAPSEPHASTHPHGNVEHPTYPQLYVPTLPLREPRKFTQVTWEFYTQLS